MRNQRIAISLVFVVTACPLLTSADDGAAGFTQIKKLTASDAAAFDGFGRRVALSGDVAIVGSPFDSDQGLGSGAAYLFERDAGGPSAWGQIAKLTAPDGASADWFGNRVAIEGTTAIVSASVNDEDRSGYAYIFERDAGGPGAWGPVAKLLDGDLETSDSYGASVAVEGDIALVGATRAGGLGGSGAVYVHERDAGGPNGWGQVAKLTTAAACEDNVSFCGWRYDGSFGGSVGISGDTIVVGSIQDYIYIFRREVGNRWRRVGRPIPAEGVRLDGFGISVAIHTQTVLVGAYADDDLDTNAGAAYVVEPQPGRPPRWRDVAKLTAPDGESGDRLGTRVSIDEDILALGAPQTGLGRDSQGEAYVLQRSAGTAGLWRSISNLTASDGEPGDLFGNSIAVSGHTVLVGAEGDDDFGSQSGAAYVFQAASVPSELRHLEMDRDERRSDTGNLVGLDENALVDLPSNRAEHRTVRSIETGLDADDEAGPAPVSRIQEPAASPLPSGATAESSQLCLKFIQEFIPFCDGMELTVSGDTLHGVWRRLDNGGSCGENFEVPVSGTLYEDSAVLYCDARTDPCPVGLTWAWIIDRPLDGTMVMLQKDKLWGSWIDTLRYLSSPGPCS